MYKVIKFFTDLQDNDHAYHVGDIFPREGLEVSEKRLVELSTDQNKRGIPLIEAVVERPVEPTSPKNDAQEPEIEAVDDQPKEDIAEETEKPKKGRKTTKKD